MTPEEQKRLDEIRERMKQIFEEGERLRDEEFEILTAAAMREYDIKPGDIVLYRGGRFMVSEVQGTRFGGKPWISGRTFNKDGSLSKRERSLFSHWEKVNESNEGSETK